MHQNEAPGFRRLATLAGLLCSVAAVGRVDAQAACAPLPPPAGPTIEVTPDQADQLRGLVAGAASGTTFLLHDGTYAMNQGDSVSRLTFATPGVSLRSLSGNRDAVVLDGDYQTDELISVRASDVVIASVTLREAWNHPIHVSGGPEPITGTVIHDVRVVDPGQQAIKINPNGEGWADDGLIECSHLELTDAGREEIRDNCYTGGIDAHAAWGWTVRRNTIRGFWCDAGLSEHAIHFWRESRDTLVEQNRIIDCARGIGLGLGQSGPGRDYEDDPFPGIDHLEHIDGVVRNNFVAATDPDLFDSAAGFDAGISVDQSRRPTVIHNTVVSSAAPFSSIEWRFPDTRVDLTNNLVSHNLRPRDGAQATTAGNLDGAPTAWFVDPPSGDLHLTDGDLPPIDGAVPTPPGLADTDFDGEARSDPHDVGADERLAGIFADGFESGDTTGWPVP